MSDCQQSTTGGIPHSRVLSPGGVSYTGQRRSYSKSPTGSLKPHPDTTRTTYVSPLNGNSTGLEDSEGLTHLTVCDVAAEQFKILHGLWPFPLTEFRWQSQQAELSIRHGHRLHILSTFLKQLQMNCFNLKQPQKLNKSGSRFGFSKLI